MYEKILVEFSISLDHYFGSLQCCTNARGCKTTTGAGSAATNNNSANAIINLERKRKSGQFQ